MLLHNASDANLRAVKDLEKMKQAERNATSWELPKDTPSYAQLQANIDEIVKMEQADQILMSEFKACESDRSGHVTRILTALPNLRAMAETYHNQATWEEMSYWVDKNIGDYLEATDKQMKEAYDKAKLTEHMRIVKENQRIQEITQKLHSSRSEFAPPP